MDNLKEPFIRLHVDYDIKVDRYMAALQFGSKTGHWLVWFDAAMDGSVSRKDFATALRKAASRICPPKSKGKKK